MIASIWTLTCEENETHINIGLKSQSSRENQNGGLSKQDPEETIGDGPSL